MENISLLIITDDKEYGKALGTGIIDVCRNFIIKISNWESFFAEKNNYYKYDLILWDGMEARDAYGDKIILLSPDPAVAVKNYQERKFCLYKYSNTRGIVSALLDIYSFITGKCAVNLKQRNVELMVFASAYGGSGTTTLALAAGQELSRFRGKKVLYVSFEQVESTALFMECPAGMKNAGVYLYHLFRNRNGFPFIESYLVRDDYGVEAFYPTAGKNPLRNLTCDELNVFLSSLVECGRYDVIILDIGNNLYDNDLMCMDISGKICLVGKINSDDKREAQYLQYVMCNCGEKIIDKMIKIRNMTPEKDVYSETNTDDMLETFMCVNKCSGIISKDGINKIILENNFGEKIRILTEKLMERNLQI